MRINYCSSSLPCVEDCLASRNPDPKDRTIQVARLSKVFDDVPGSASSQHTNRLPQNSWDSHMHIIDPSIYPLAADAQYEPHVHLLDQALEFEQSIGFSNVVIVQPSIYGNDNTCMLDALRALGPDRARGVVAFDPDTVDVRTLAEWHNIGVRGVRINLQSTGKQMTDQELTSLLCKYADVIRPLGWVLQLYIPLAMTTLLDCIIARLNVKICLDHFGSPSMPKSVGAQRNNPYDIVGFPSLVRLLQNESVYVKISAPYRLGRDEYEIESLAKELLQLGGGRRVVFATDWPHTRFSGFDIRPFVAKVMEWCDNDIHLIDQVFRDNAVDLWDSKGKC